MATKKKVVVMYGGQSTEHEISCRSAAFILRNLDQQKYDIHAIGIDKQGHWWPQDVQKLLATKDESISIQKDENMARSSEIAKSLLPTVGGQNVPRDVVVFPILHGTNGEDGAMQGLFDLSGIAYVGADTMASAIGMNKLVSKQLVEMAGIEVVPYLAFRKHEWTERRDGWIKDISKKFPYPVFVKPASLGSSVGISKVKAEKDLAAALDAAFAVDELVLVEEGFEVREIEYAALGGYDAELTAAGEIVVQAADFYSYEEKYSKESKAEVVVPAKMDAAKMEEGRKMCAKIFRALHLFGMARIDLFLTKKDQKFYFNEVNTIPGFTSISQYPQLWKHSGLNASQLLDRLLSLAMARRDLRQGLVRSH